MIDTLERDWSADEELHGGFMIAFVVLKGDSWLEPEIAGVQDSLR